MFQFVFIFYIIFMFHEHNHYSYFISYTFLVSCLLHMTFHILVQYDVYVFICIHTSFMYSCPSMNLFYLEIGIIPIGSSKPKLWHFHAKLVNLPILPEGQFSILIFQCLDSIFDTDSLDSFQAKVLWVLLQLESPKSEHRNSSYVLNNRDYSMVKNRSRNWLEHIPTLSELLAHIGSEFEGSYFLMFGDS